MARHAARISRGAVVAPLGIAGCLGLWLLTAACGNEPPRSPDQPSTVRAYLPTRPVSLSFIGKASDTNSEILASLVTDSLVQYDADLVLQPRVAEAWSFSEDHRELTFRLRDGVTWQDGEPVTARDVIYSVRMVREPALENRTFGPLFDEDRVRVEAVDDRTIRALYDTPSPEDLEMWRLPLVPAHLAGREARPGDGSAVRLMDSEFARHPIGCGPYRFVAEEPDREIVLEANPTYWDGPPAVERLVIKIFPDQRTAYQALLTGELDVMHLTSALYEEALASAAAERLAGFVYHKMSVWQITWNQDGSNPFFTDPRVRRAMVLALDRNHFNEKVLGGTALPAITAIHPDSPLASPTLEPWPFDPDEARRLLAEAGWIDRDGDGVRERDGRAFEFEHLYPSSSQQIVDQMAAWEQQSWADVGIVARDARLEWKAMRERRNARRFEAASFTMSFTPSAENLYQLHHSASRSNGFNFAGLADPRIDALLQQARHTFDDAARQRLYGDLQQRLHELEPITCVFHFATPVLHDRRLSGVTPSALDYWRTTAGPRIWRWIESDTGAEVRASR